ncbi:MAG: hypothetical protein AAGJ54_01045 [Planctomycetota bacterium]
MRSIAAIALLAAAGSGLGQSISLASTMDTDSFVSENAITGAFAQIGQGDGSLGSVGSFTGDADGFYFLSDLGQANPSPIGGSDPLDLFPREENFQVGSLGFDDAAIGGSGVETTAVTSLDLSELWTSDPNRVNGSAGSPPLVISDISDRALGLWFFDSGGSITFGGLDSADTVTFTNGQLTSIDVEVDAFFTIDGSDDFVGSLVFSGDGISFQVEDTQTLGGFFTSTIVIDLTGTVNAVVPAPGTAMLLVAGVFGASRRRR